MTNASAPHDCTYCRLRRMRPRWLREAASAVWLSVTCARCGRRKLPGDYRRMDVCYRCNAVLTGHLTRDWRWG